MHKIKNGMEDKIKDILASNKFNDLYDNFIELQKDCDVSFNIFTMISDKYHLENMHTDIIKCFLDPKEGHNEGYKFLFLFIDMINAIGKEGININKDLYVNAKVESQYPVDCNGEKGFIDIFISGDKHCIIFEYKINYASDTYNQLPKYYGFCSQKYTVDAIVYLPLSDNKTPDKGTWDGKLLKEIEEKLIVLNAFKYNKINFIDNWILLCSQKTNNIHCISILRQYSNLVKSLKKETMAENLLSLLLEKNINITSFLDITEGIPKAMLTNLCNQLNINKIAKLFQFTSKEDKIYCEYGNNTNDNIPNVHIDFLIEKNKYYLRVFDNNGILNLKADEFGENLNLTLDDELKLHKEYPYEGKTTINIIFSDLKEIDKVIQGKLLIK